MRRLLLSLCLLALPLFASAQQREALLTPDGTLFSIQSIATEVDGTSYGSAHLLLRAQRGAEVVQEIVPATLERGAHNEPVIAFDAESQTLFVFWLRRTGLLGSQLMFACRDKNGTWSDAEAFGHEFNDRRNLRMALTRRSIEADGTASAEAALSVHLAWWEFDAATAAEAAQYAMVTVENGRVAAMNGLDLSAFAVAGEGEAIAADADRAVLTQPLLFSAPEQDSVLLVFGDYATSRMHQVRVRPTKVVANGRLRVPVGRGEGSVGRPSFAVAANSRMDGIYGGSTRMALYAREAGRLQYVIMKDGVWTETRSISLDEQITSAAAVDALRRLLTEH